MSAYLHAFGAHLPPRVVSNVELAERLSCTPEWIETVSGIRERRWAADETSVADLALAAAEDCLGRCGVDKSKLGMLILASGSATPGFPGPAAEVAARLGLENTPVLDLPMASAGSLFGMALASRLADSMGDILVIAAEKMSAVIQAHPLDQNTAILFGDGAGAVLIGNREGPRRILHSVLHTSGELRQELSYDWKSGLKMNGGSVILHASRKIPGAIREVLEHESIAPADVSAFVVHQANQNLLVRVAKALAVPAERVFSNIARYGNTSSASLLIAAAECDPLSNERPGERPGPVVFAAFGAGFHWGALVAA